MAKERSAPPQAHQPHAIKDPNGQDAAHGDGWTAKAKWATPLPYIQSRRFGGPVRAFITSRPCLRHEAKRANK